jgi:simple sugar transport system ATP-binding protein
MMIGSELPECHLLPREPGEVRLRVNNLSMPTGDPFGTELWEVILEVRSGEILGIAGVSGNGQKELLAALSGEAATPNVSDVLIDGRPVGNLNPAQRRRLGLTFVPEERLGRGAVPPMSLSGNALLTGSRHGMVKMGIVNRAATRFYARSVIERFKVKCGGDSAFAASLSGGNLQKYIVGRETMMTPRVMVVAQPTWGVDVGAAVLIRQALIDLRNDGVAVLVVSEELDELFMISDRIAVIAQGRMSPTRPLAEVNIEQIGTWMSGQFESAQVDRRTTGDQKEAVAANA